jgi:hypothetical protein
MSEHRLSEIVIERPRGGMRISLKKLKGFKKQLQKLTEDAAQDGLLSPYLIKPRNKSKYLSDHLGPLRRFLRSHVGQSWDDVYSKLCQQLHGNTMAGRHVLDHVQDYVELHVELIDGVPYRKSKRQYRLDHWHQFQLYVHPETGLLCDAKAIVSEAIAPSLKPKHRLDVVELDKFHQYRRINDIWYLITYREMPATEIVFDVLDRVTVVSHANGYGNQLYAAHKRQCNKREIRMIQKKLNQLA